MRFILKGTARDGHGQIISSATVSVYLAGTTTVASVYAASAGGTAVNSVTSGTDGSFTLYVDDSDYYQSQKFKVTVSKTGYTSKTYDDVVIFALGQATVKTALPSDGAGENGDFAIVETTDNHQFAWQAGDVWYTSGRAEILAAVPSAGTGTNGEIRIIEATGLHAIAWKAGGAWYVSIGGTTEGSAGNYSWESSL